MTDARFTLTHEDGSIVHADWVDESEHSNYYGVSLLSGGYVQIPRTWDVHDRGGSYAPGAVVRNTATGEMVMRGPDNSERPWKIESMLCSDAYVTSKIVSGDFKMIFEGYRETN